MTSFWYSITFWQILGVVLIICGTGIGGFASYLDKIEGNNTIAGLQNELESFEANNALRKLDQTLEQVRSGSVNEQNQISTLNYVDGADYDSTNNDLLIPIFEESVFYPFGKGSLFKFELGWKLVAHKEILKNYPEVLNALVGAGLMRRPNKEMDFAKESFTNDHVFDLVIKNIYENGGFVDGSHIDSIDGLLWLIRGSERNTEYVFQLVRTSEDKQHIQDEYISVIHEDKASDKNYYWDELLRAEESATMQNTDVER